MAWSSTLVSGAWRFQQWSGAYISYTLKVVHSTLLGLFHKRLGIPNANGEFSQEPMSGTWLFCLTPLLTSVEFPQEPICGWYMAVLLDTPAGECGISPGDYLWVVLLCRHGCSPHMGR